MRSHPWAQFVHMVNAVVLRITPDTRTRAHVHTHKHTCTHRHTRAHTHTHSRAHTRTYTLHVPCPPGLSLSLALSTLFACKDFPLSSHLASQVKTYPWKNLLFF